MRIVCAVVALSLFACSGAKPKQQQPARTSESGEGERDMLEDHELEQDGETTSYETDVDVTLSDHETEKHDDADAAGAGTPGAMDHANKPKKPNEDEE